MHEIKRESADTLRFGRFTGIRDITQLPSLIPSACFVGPRAQNIGAMRMLAEKALVNIQDFRTGFKPGDPSVALESGTEESIATMMERYDDLLDFLGTYSTPFPSMRYQAHMLWDNLLPALGAYFVGMMYNPNNVTIQASTATTLLEMQVMRDLCDMFALPPITLPTPDGGTYASGPWAHITADGSVANIEGLWSAREAKYLPFAMRAAIQNEASLAPAKGITVVVCDGTKVPLLQATDWQLLNIVRDQRLALPSRVATLAGLQASDVWPLAAQYDINAVGLSAFPKIPVLVVPSTAHYSWPKAAGLTGLGTNGCVHIDVDAKARMSMDKLETFLKTALANQTPIMTVVSVFGSTEEGAVDPLDQILSLRDTYRQKGLDFDVHVDSAWGGYFVSVIRRAFAFDTAPDDDPFLSASELGGTMISDYVADQARLIRHADSLTIDPHKMGYVQYPAGSVAYANEDVINLTTFTGSYIGSSADPTVGLFGVEGSRPGASAAAVYFSHACLRPDVTGYGQVINRALVNRLIFYAFLPNVAAEGMYKTVTLTPQPDTDVFAQVKANLLAGKAMLDGIADTTSLRQYGPDQNLVDYGINAIENGVLNTDPNAYNAFVQAVYDQFHVGYTPEGQPEDIQKYNFLVSMTTFNRADYGDAFMDSFAQRLGLKGSPQSLNCLRSTVMDPFVDQIDGSPGMWWPTIIGFINDGVKAVYQSMYG